MEGGASDSLNRCRLELEPDSGRSRLTLTSRMQELGGSWGSSSSGGEGAYDGCPVSPGQSEERNLPEGRARPYCVREAPESFVDLQMALSRWTAIRERYSLNGPHAPAPLTLEAGGAWDQDAG